MEYNKMIEMARKSTPDAPSTDEVLVRMHRTLRRRRQQQTLLTGIAGIALITIPLLTTNYQLPTTTPSPTLAETVSATLPSTPDGMPAPLQGYRNSLRNHQTLSLI